MMLSRALRTALTVLFLAAQQPMHRTNRAKIMLLLKQSLVNLSGRLVGVFIALHDLNDGYALLLAERPRPHNTLPRTTGLEVIVVCALAPRINTAAVQASAWQA
jgi:hypothetical protein